MITNTVKGFSKKNKTQKIDWLIQTFLKGDDTFRNVLEQYWNSDEQLQGLHDDFIENTLTNFYLPFAIAPNFVINGKAYAIPMVIEESSVVAAASNAAKFWMDRGGFRTEVVSTLKNGQVHIHYLGSKESLKAFYQLVEPILLSSLSPIEGNMKKRGGGIQSLQLIDKTSELDGYYQLHATFETKDAMGANFINSCLEEIAKTFENEASKFEGFSQNEIYPEVVMSILSNYVPECLVRAKVCCPISQLENNGFDGETFAQNFTQAVAMARVEPRRAVTHNKGIMNGIDAVILATGNDFRAVEAGVHAFAARDGQYRSLTKADVTDGVFTFEIEIPLALGTIGGLTSLHPLVKVGLKILQEPSAEELMQIVAVAGLAQNFAALRSLVTTGIQKGHMKMHLMNILNQIKADTHEKEAALKYFQHEKISHSSVTNFIEKLRS